MTIYDSFEGTWATESFGELVLHVNGTRVEGTFGNEGGTVTGTAFGPLLNHGKWYQRANGGRGATTGSFQLILAPHGQSFTGTWTYDNTSDGSGGQWNGTRVVKPGR